MPLLRRPMLWLCAVLLLTVSTFPVAAQEETPVPLADDVTGVWVGVLYQSGGGVSKIYPFTMVLSQDGSAVTGTSFISLPDEPATYGMMELSGSLDGDSFDFEESRILSQSDIDFRWCIKKGVLIRDEDAMTGRWEGDAGCSPGQITLVRVSDDPFLQAEQSDALSGLWVGTLEQQARGIDTEYPFAMVLVAEGSRVTGSSFIALSDDPNNYGVMVLEGVFEDNQFDFEETRLILESSIDFDWCMISGSLLLEDTNLRGQWESEMDCSTGRIRLERLEVVEEDLPSVQAAGDRN